jgi:carbon-monoxide dehydrogenase medium subunit
MKAPPFQYACAQSVSEALDLLAEYKDDALVLAGGQSLMPVLNMRLASPSVLIDINPLTELAGLKAAGGVLHIGAMTRHREVAESALVREHLPLITQAMRHVAHPAIQNRGTFGGSLATADPSAEMPACCLALGARILLESKRGRRSVEADDFFRGIFETAREPDELLVGVEIPIPDSAWRPCFMEFARRHGDYAIAGVAALAKLDAARISDIRIVLFGVEARPSRARAAEEAITNAGALTDGIADAQAALTNVLVPLADNHASGEMRIHYARVLIERVALELTGANRA